MRVVPSTQAPADALLYLSAAEVAELVKAIDPVEVVAGAFLALRDGRAGITPEAALRWTAADGTAARSLILPARYAGAYGCKIINACIGNPDRGLPRAHGLIVLADPDTAAPAGILEGGLISALRTAAVSTVALRAVRELGAVRHLALLGCGRQARTHLELLAARTRLATVTVYDAVPERAAAFARAAGALVPAAGVTVADSARAAVSTAEVSIAATTTTSPYVPLEWLPRDAVFLNVSLDDATEELLLGCGYLVVDDWALVREDETRLLGRLARAGRVSGPGVPAPPGGRAVDAELATLVAGSGPGPTGSAGPVVVNPFGMGIHDIAIGAGVYAAALERGAGTWLPR
ncbi:ornithine cyclodeaminase [Rhizomonospora bruguierae]|uniref:ornithine cyclodeaminase n=1 Tax=Rhizomonospora bruguierae TaxID=1581705 RepID=UPI0020BF3BB1|nr:ornithine cyclodeaminase [Micromonospora sp. NBRC 107566]